MAKQKQTPKAQEKAIEKEVKERDPIEANPDTAIPTELPEIGNAEKSDIEKSVEESEEHTAKGYEDQGEATEEKEAVVKIVEQKEPKKGNYAEADIKEPYVNPNSNIEEQVVSYAPEQKEADIK